MADTSYVDVQPRKVTLSFAGVPSGVALTLDGQPQATPFSVIAVVGMERDLGAPTPQVIGPDSLEWVSWSDGGAPLHTIVTPTTSTTYTATYQVVAIVNQHPIVTLTAPLDGATVTQGTATPVTATASDPDGTVTSVEFFDGTTSLGTDNSSPYSVTWTPTTLGRTFADRHRHSTTAEPAPPPHRSASLSSHRARTTRRPRCSSPARPTGPPGSPARQPSPPPHPTTSAWSA